MKGYQSDRVVQSFDAVGSRRDLLRVLAIGLPALILVSVGGKQNSPALHGDEPVAPSGREAAVGSDRKSSR